MSTNLTKRVLKGDVRALALFQVWFYGILEECFLRILDAD